MILSRLNVGNMVARVGSLRLQVTFEDTNAKGLEPGKHGCVLDAGRPLVDRPREISTRRIGVALDVGSGRDVMTMVMYRSRWIRLTASRSL